MDAPARGCPGRPHQHRGPAAAERGRRQRTLRWWPQPTAAGGSGQVPMGETQSGPWGQLLRGLSNWGRQVGVEPLPSVSFTLALPGDTSVQPFPEVPPGWGCLACRIPELLWDL